MRKMTTREKVICKLSSP